MFVSEKDLVFVSVNEGVSQKNQKPYRIVKLANPKTFENYSISAKTDFNLANFEKGEIVRPKIELEDFFGRTQVVITDLIPAATAK